MARQRDGIEPATKDLTQNDSVASDDNDTPQCFILKCPNELLAKIFGHFVSDTVPLYLEDFIDAGRVRRYRQGTRFRDFTVMLDSSQRSNMAEWLAINGVCGRFRTWGKPIFFSEKTLIMTSKFAKRLDASKFPNGDLMLSRIRHIIVRGNDLVLTLRDIAI